MKHKLFTFILALTASIGTIFAWDYERVQIGDLYYNLDASNQTAEVTWQKTDIVIGWEEPNYSGLTTVAIPSSVEYNTVTYSVTSIGDRAFEYCPDLTSITIPNSVSSIGYGAFGYCSGLTYITIPNSVTSIGDYAFYGCDGLTAIDVATDNPSYCSEAGVLFNKDKSTIVAYPKGKLSSTYTIPNSVTSIGDRAFADCSGLTSIEIPNSITSIGYGAFYDCSGLTSIEIPSSVIGIRGFAFYGCSGLTSMTNYAITPQSIESDVFGGDENWGEDVNKSIPFYVPAGSISAYQAADGWSDFTNIQAIPMMAITVNEDPLNAGDFYTTFYHGTKRYRLPGDGTEAYVADLSGGELLLTRIAQGNQVLPNNVAVIFRAPTSTITLSETSTTGVSFSAENDLRGVDVVTPLEDLGLTRATCYVLSGNSTDGVGFFQCNSDNLKAHKAYLPYAGGPAGAPKHIRFVFDETEDVGQVQGENVQGTKVLRKGQLIIIRNGVEYNIAGQIVK